MGFWSAHIHTRFDIEFRALLKLEIYERVGDRNYPVYKEFEERR